MGWTNLLSSAVSYDFGDDVAVENGRILEDRFGAEETAISPYTSIGFIVWYCFLILCCGFPICCCCVSYCCYSFRRWRHGGSDPLLLGVLARQRREEEELEREISRIEANVSAYSLKEQKQRRICLLKEWQDQKMVITDGHFIVAGKETVEKDDCHTCTYGEDDNDCLRLMLPGVNRADGSKGADRWVSSFCAICLDQYVVGDCVVWASGSQCPHVFHEECIASWLMTRHNALCPCCRQQFSNDVVSPAISLTPQELVEVTLDNTSADDSTDSDSEMEDDHLALSMSVEADDSV